MADRIPNWQRQAWLTEYQVCQHDNSSSSLGYWTLAGIFIGISSVLLAGLVYGMLANIQELTIIGAKYASTLRIIICGLGAGMIIILIFLCFWSKRENYLADRNYERMREIELQLGMWKSWKICVLDLWNKKRCKLCFKKTENLSDDDINEIWQKTLEEEKLTKGLSEESLGLLADRQEELFEICYRCEPQRWYESPSRYLHFPMIFCILIGLWAFFIGMALCIIS